MSLQDELRQSGFNGCIAAADELDRLTAELAAVKAERDAVRGMFDEVKKILGEK